VSVCDFDFEGCITHDFDYDTFKLNVVAFTHSSPFFKLFYCISDAKVVRCRGTTFGHRKVQYVFALWGFEPTVLAIRHERKSVIDDTRDYIAISLVMSIF
jgi:hypothetical protein